MGFLDTILNLDVAFTTAKSKAWCAAEELSNKDADDIIMDIESGVRDLLREIDIKIYEFGIGSEYLSDELSGKTMVEANNCKIAYINKLNEEMQKMANEAKQLNENTKRAFNISNNRLFYKKKEVYRTTLHDFANTISALKEVEFGEFNIEKVVVSKMQNKEITFVPCFAGEVEDFDSLNNVIAFSIAGGLGVMISAAWKSIELDEKMVEAESKHAALKAKCESNKKDCVKIEGIISICDSTHETIVALDELTRRLIIEVDKIISSSGSDYSFYNEEEKNKVMMMVNFSLALNDLICTDVFDAKGKKNKFFDKVYNEVQDMIN